MPQRSEERRVQRAPHAQHVSPVPGCRSGDTLYLAVLAKLRLDSDRLFAPRFGARAGQKCDFIEYDRRIFDERAVGMHAIDSQRTDIGAALAQGVAVTQTAAFVTTKTSNNTANKVSMQLLIQTKRQ